LAWLVVVALVAGGLSSSFAQPIRGGRVPRSRVPVERVPVERKPERVPAKPIVPPVEKLPVMPPVEKLRVVKPLQLPTEPIRSSLRRPSKEEADRQDLLAEIVGAHAEQISRKVAALAGQGKTVSPATRALVKNALYQHSASVAAHADATLESGKPPSTDVIKESRGRLVLTRDFDLPPTGSRAPPVATETSNAVVYIADQLLAGREGLLADVGGQAAVSYLEQRFPVTVSQLRGDAAGLAVTHLVPDRLEDRATHVGFERPRADRHVRNGEPPTAVILVYHAVCHDEECVTPPTLYDDCRP
jgi:hypothetical protein